MKTDASSQRFSSMITIFELSVQVRPKGKPASAVDAIRVPITNLEDSAVYPRLFRLTNFILAFWRTRENCIRLFRMKSVSKLGQPLNIVEQIVGHHILDGYLHYQTDLPSNAELQAIRQSTARSRRRLWWVTKNRLGSWIAMKHISKRPSCAKN